MSFQQPFSALKKLPPTPAFWRLIGPSFIILGLGLGSGEVILWPYLTANFGLGIIWGALVGITLQFFINTEVERYALIYGESIFVGFAKLFKWLPLWFIFSTFAGFGWPGIGLAGATLFSHVLGFNSPRAMGVILFLLVGVILSVGKVLYDTVEHFQKLLIGLGVPFIFLLTVYLAGQADFTALGQGLLGAGQGYKFLPAGIPLLTFLGALAYAGAGGNLNLAQSIYVRDKGYGMGKFAQKIKSVFRKGRPEEIRLSGTTFAANNPQNLTEFKRWWKVVNLEHLLVFWFLGLFTMLLLSLLAFTTTFGSGDTVQGLNFLLAEAQVIAQKTFPLVGTLFLLVAGLMLFSTQLGVLETTSRIMTENYLLWRKVKKANVSRVFYLILWAQIIFGITVFLLGFDEPRDLITLGAVINALAMFVYTGLLLWLNNRFLAKPLRPSLGRNLVLAFAFVFFGGFSLLTLF